MEIDVEITQDGTYMGEDPTTMEDKLTEAEMLEVVAAEVRGD